MRLSLRKLMVGTAAAVALMVPASLAWSCVGLVLFRVEGSSSVQPGGMVQVMGGEFARGKPVDVHLDSPSGPVLATFASPQPSTMTSKFLLDVPIPADVSPGPHILVATQDHYDMNVGIPARATIYVNTSAPAAPTPADRSGLLAVDSGPAAGGYILIGLGVAAAGLLFAAGASAIAGRQSSAKAEGVKAS